MASSSSSNSAAITEGDDGTFTVQLATQPNGRKIISLTSDNADVTLSPASLTFTTSNWSTVQTVTFAASEDGGSDDETAQVSLAGRGITTGTVDISVRDDDFTGHLRVSPSVIEIIEGQMITASSQLASALTISVDHEPTLDNLSLMLGDPAAAELQVGTGGAGISMQYRRGSSGQSAGGTPVPFSATDFIHAMEDADIDDETYTVPITVQATGGDYGGFEGATASFTMRVLDNDAVVLEPFTASLVLDEAGTETFKTCMSIALSCIEIKIGCGVVVSAPAGWKICLTCAARHRFESLVFALRGCRPASMRSRPPRRGLPLAWS